MSLFKIQNELKAPKGQTNNFGKYKYRSCEDIVEAVKPILHKYETSLVISDSIELIGDRYYIKATAKLTGETINAESIAYAREPLTKKGMDEAQITGATSSYARKYALNGLLAIDDTKDADTMDNSQPQQQLLNKQQKYSKFKSILALAGIQEKDFLAYLEKKGLKLTVIIDKFITDKCVQANHFKQFKENR